MTETRDSAFLQRVERQCDAIPEWLAKNPGWHRWPDIMRMPQFVGYIPPHSRAIRERLERDGRIRVANGHMRGGRPILVAHPTEDTPPPRTIRKPRVKRPTEDKGVRQREVAARATTITAALVALADALMYVPAIAQNVERIATMLANHKLTHQD